VVIVVDWLLTSKKVNGVRKTLVTNGFKIVHCLTALLAQFALDKRLQNVATSLQTNVKSVSEKLGLKKNK